MYFNDLKIKIILILILHFNIFILLSCTSDKDFDNSGFTSEVDSLLPDSKFVIIGKSSQQPSNMILRSSDGLIWESIDLLNSNIDVQSLTLDFQDLIYSDQFVAITTSSVMYSTDGKIWDKFNMSSLNIDYINLRGIAYGNNTYVMINEGVYNNAPKIFFSNNLINWNNYDATSFLPDQHHPDSITFCNNYFWILTSDEDIYKSQNGSSWIKTNNSSVNGSLSCFENKLILSNDNLAKSSEDGEIFDYFPSSDTNIKLQGIAYKQPYYVIINKISTGHYIKIAMSLSGDWTDAIGYSQIGTSEKINKIIFKNNIFVLVTDKGQIYTSNDGYSWTKNLSVITNQYMNFVSVQ